MQSNQKIIFFVIVGFAFAMLVGTLVIERVGNVTLPWHKTTQVAIQVAVPPALSGWAEACARDFNHSNSDAQVTVVAINSLSAVGQFGQSSARSRPQAWIPEATFVAIIAQEQGVPFETTGKSVTASDLVWGAFRSRETALVDRLGNLDWAAVHQAAASGGWSELGGEASWGYFKLTLASPSRSAEGLAALFSAAAAYHGRSDLTYDAVTDSAFLAWLKTIVLSVPSFSTLGPEPAETLATRGPSIGDVGLLTAAAWKRSQTGLAKWENFVTATPRFTARLDYPYILRTDLDKTEQEMARRFGAYLQSKTDRLATFGFDAQATVSADQVKPDNQAVLALFHWAERERIGQ